MKKILLIEENYKCTGHRSLRNLKQDKLKESHT